MPIYSGGGISGIGPQKFDAGITQVRNDIAGVKTDTEQIKTDTGEVKEGMEQLVANVQKQVDELREIVENSPAGILPPPVSSFSVKSSNEGIITTYKANSIYNYNGASSFDNTSNAQLSLTKGVMVRYSDVNFPIKITDGTLAFTDEDLFDINSTGMRQPKEKSNTITGLTNGKMYYISIFPYSTYNVYNETAGISGNQRKTCQWTGTKGTLTVNVTQDYDYKPLGEYTATMTPTAGGQAITKTQSGAATVVFSALEAGQYTLSFSEVASFTKPADQSVTVTAGQSQTISTQYQLNVSLSTLSWKEIKDYTVNGLADELFSVGDTKNINAKKCTFSSKNEYSTEEVSANAVILGINTDAPNTITFCVNVPLLIATQNGNNGWYYNNEPNLDSTIREKLLLCLNTMFDSEITSCMKEVTKKTDDSNEKYSPGNSKVAKISTTYDKAFPLSITEIGFGNYCTAYEKEQPSSAYPYFTGNDRRDSLGAPYETRSWLSWIYGWPTYCGFHGVQQSGYYNKSYGTIRLPICFVIG